MGLMKKIAKGVKKAGKGVKKAGKFAYTYFDKKAKNQYTGIVVVYDGKAPEFAAKNLYDLLKELGQEVIIYSSDKYSDVEHLYTNAKVIIVGHHSLAKNKLEYVGKLKHDIFGIKFGYSGNLCVLRASDSELKKLIRINRAQFYDYYYNRMRNCLEFAKKYNVPMEVGVRKHTRETQYDLLLVDFTVLGLSEFLGFDIIQKEHI